MAVPLKVAKIPLAAQAKRGWSGSERSKRPTKRAAGVAGVAELGEAGCELSEV
jgi:hypothetical protein